MLIEIHMLKNYPPVNLNRDETGAPKTCMFGNALRARISSQCLKRTWRTDPIFRAEVGEENLGIRTRRLPVLVAERLLEMGVPSDYVEAVKSKLTGFGNKEGKENKDPDTTAQMIFYSREDIDAVAETVKAILDQCDTVKEVKALKAKDLQAAVSGANVRGVSLDTALFGRMVTSDAFRNIEAAVQVAHAISCNKAVLESDYFTAMDDLLAGIADEAGAGMIGETDFNSACFYHFAAIDTDQLLKNLEYADEPEAIVRKAIPVLLRTMAFSNPSGKQNSFAGHVLPSAVMIECKNTKIPTSMVGAFEKPIYATGNLVQESVKALASHADMLARNYGLKVEQRMWFCVDKYDDIKPETAGIQVFSSFPEMVEAVAASL